jgi:hypothetical protein
MNFIEAWKKANGKEIIIKDEKGIKEHTRTDGNIKIYINSHYLSNESLLSEKWEVAKESKVIWVVTYKYDNISYQAVIFFTREEMDTWKEKNNRYVTIIGTEKYIHEY